MSREIVFRGYQKGLKKWVFGNLIQTPSGGCWIFHWENNFEDRVQVTPESVGQYTGIKTHNGTKIFEGDIIDDKYKFVVSWIKDAFYAIGERNTWLLHEIVNRRIKAGCHPDVIGNIYENPLIKNDSIQPIQNGDVCPACGDYGIVQDEQGRNDTCHCHYV